MFKRGGRIASSTRRALIILPIWTSSLVWMWTPWLAVNANYSAVRSSGDGCGSPGAADRPWKKNARNPEPAPRVTAAGHSG